LLFLPVSQNVWTMSSTKAVTTLFRLGVALVAGAAITWSFGGTIARFLTVHDSWTVVFWRATFATIFLLALMLVRDGLRGTVDLFRNMGWAGVGVGTCVSIASSTFVIALKYTTVANILLIQAGTPLIAALLASVLFGEHVSKPTWMAIAAVIAGVAIMVSPSLTGGVPPIGDGLALLIPLAFATGTVITRRHSMVRMVPAVCLGTTMSAMVAATLASGFVVTSADLAWFFAFGALNLGLGLSMFVSGARLIPAAAAAILSTLETVLGPIWVWLIHGEVLGEMKIVVSVVR
jgi:drug/metabolite transporter (DMT)-like permease